MPNTDAANSSQPSVHSYYSMQLHIPEDSNNFNVKFWRTTCFHLAPRLKIRAGIASVSYTFMVKGKCTPVQALRLCTGRTAHRRSRVIALLLHDHRTRREWGVSVTPRPLFTLGKEPVPIVQETGWAPGPVWTGAESLRPPTEIRSPDRPARSQSLYQLRYLALVT